MRKAHPVEKWLKRLILISLSIFINHFSMAYATQKTVLVLGDSLSAEYGLQRGTGWVALLEQRIQQKKLNVSVINASISGDTSSGGAARLAELLKKYQPTTVVIELGGNDGLRGLTLSASEQNFRSMIAASKAAKANVLLVGMQIPPNYGKTYTEQFEKMYPKIAKQTNIPLVPFLLAGVADQANLFQADRIHLIAAAHPRILDNVWPYLLPLISK